MDIAYSVQLYIFVNGRRLVENETTAVAMLFVERHLNATFYAEHPTLGLDLRTINQLWVVPKLSSTGDTGQSLS